MKKSKIIFYGFLAIIIVLLIISLIIQTKGKHEAEKEATELMYNQTKTIIETKNLQNKFLQVIDTANYYREKNKGHEKKLNEIYNSALSDSDELVLQFFTDRFPEN